MPHVIGYLDRLAAHAGDVVAVHVSTDAEAFTAQSVRLRHGDRNPAGPGERAEPVDFGVDGAYAGRRQVARPGSYATGELTLPAGDLELHLWVLPTRPRTGTVQAIVTLGGVALAIDARGHLTWAGATLAVPAGAWQWLEVTAVLGDDRAQLTARETARPRRSWHAAAQDARAVAGRVDVLLAAAAAHAGRRDGFDGRIEAPTVRVAGVEVAAWRADAPAAPAELLDAGPQQAHLRLVHAPQRAVLGHRDRAGEPLTAIHFHADDLEDAGWEPDVTLTVPPATPSGVYAVRVAVDGDSDTIPLIVRPPRDRATADVALLFPTFTYLAYANERLQDGPRDVPIGERALPVVPDRGDLLLRERRDLGLSTYDQHADGSGCCMSSALRPILNFRPDHRNWQTHAPRALGCDLYLVDWLTEQRVAFDALDDLLLHEQGAELLQRYRVLLTGSHPEYWSAPMLDALETFLDRGGRLMYLGGNGFYWVTSLDPDRPHLVEIRRGHNGTRSWEPRPGETVHASDGVAGGLWRYHGRGPNHVAGIGFSAQGYGPRAAPFAQTAAATDPRAAWIFDGVPADALIGDRGLIMDGAAGDEIDRADIALGTPPHALVVATSAGRHADSVSVVVEDLLIAHPAVDGTRHPGVRADVVFFETPDGGAVFSAGSMGWNGCLSWDGYANPVSRMTANVLARFRDPRPFVPPDAG